MCFASSTPPSYYILRLLYMFIYIYYSRPPPPIIPFIYIYTPSSCSFLCIHVSFHPPPLPPPRSFGRNGLGSEQVETSDGEKLPLLAQVLRRLEEVANAEMLRLVGFNSLAWLLLGSILHFGLLWFSGKSPLNC